ncbi:formate dehydrogenase family accessory protein FdhD [Virgibacillus indicus]|uniref:Sulfur carrier protein FdhD n=1 Tax=Virgibacillus indicus TaxID=2024554 RepID=A0A265NB39_9BACI|nr:formate dehydrogenase accessory sulfurtransferase FdhD [Virgibacillus indicus]OZU89252.1 formate dehydrogenase family accessory protein FdhD [Virgibacillus indicus]
MYDAKRNDWEVIRFKGNSLSIENEEIATEFPLTIILNGEEFATMVCSPSNLHELLVGFLASEGIIRFYDEINRITIDEERGFAYIEIPKSLETIEYDHSKRFIGSCCGKSRQFYFKSDVKTAKTIVSRLSISVDQCYALMEQLQDRSKQFLRTGGVHNAALCTPDEVLMLRTDIGRHNALDKLYGRIIEDRIPLSDKLIVFSGRISSEVLLKISKIGVGILISKSAPTDLALRLAEDLQITAVGFARGNKLNVYTHPSRIVEANRK